MAANIKLKMTDSWKDQLTVDESLDPVILLPGLEGHEVHAPLPAVVPGIEPVPLGVLHTVVVVLPAEPVEVPVKSLDSAPVDSWNKNCVIGICSHDII